MRRSPFDLACRRKEILIPMYVAASLSVSNRTNFPEEFEIDCNDMTAPLFTINLMVEGTDMRVGVSAS